MGISFRITVALNGTYFAGSFGLQGRQTLYQVRTSLKRRIEIDELIDLSTMLLPYTSARSHTLLLGNLSY